ncbi:unnamed protein product [Polarella glacialis]|uniref:Uncharacterized protein n=1 Tax=Polarella glacialis TaxID=89957 RepID=A0A813LE34_POLGL|nr:unnamed protein product [Polarella glacialis]
METTVVNNCLFVVVSILIPLFRRSPDGLATGYGSRPATTGGISAGSSLMMTSGLHWHAGDDSLEQDMQSVEYDMIRAAREENDREKLMVGDVTKRGLAEHFSQYSLNEFFDSVCGCKEFARSEEHAELFKTLDESNRCQLADVQQRQLQLVYAGIPLTSPPSEGQTQREPTEAAVGRVFCLEKEVQYYLPPGFTEQEMRPLEVPRRLEQEERKRFEKLNMIFQEATVTNVKLVYERGWFLKFFEIQELLTSLNSWLVAAGHTNAMGIDRATFCQFLFDLELVDQKRLPYLWAVQAFDALARPTRLCQGDPDFADQTQDGRVRMVQLLNRWDFLEVLDAIVRKRFNDAPREVFMARLRAVHERLEREWQRQDAEWRQNSDEPAARELQVYKRPTTGPGPHDQEQPPPPRNSVISRASEGSSARPGSSAAKSGATEFQVWKYNRIILSMLKEPEVLNMVEQYRDVFEALFIPYASITIGSQSFMELPDFLQFSQEFHIVPSLASRHEVLRAYLAAECLEPVYACEDELKDEPEMDEIEQQIPRSSRSAAPRTSTSSATRKSRFAAAARHTIAAMTSETGLSALKITKRSNSIPAATKVENSPEAKLISKSSYWHSNCYCTGMCFVLWLITAMTIYSSVATARAYCGSFVADCVCCFCFCCSCCRWLLCWSSSIEAVGT